MPAVSPTPRVKLRSSSRRVPRQRAGNGAAVLAADPEPNMRLSRALLVMLLLHIVAIGGVCAFSVIKERNPAETTPAEADAAPPAANGADPHKGEASALQPAIQTVHPGGTLKRVVNDTGPKPGGAAADALELIEGPGAKGGPLPGDAARNAHLPADSGKTYIVGKGETPISIAHKLKVSYDALLKLNQIDDPKKLKPGQKLRVPAPPAKLIVKH